MAGDSDNTRQTRWLRTCSSRNDLPLSAPLLAPQLLEEEVYFKEHTSGRVTHESFEVRREQEQREAFLVGAARARGGGLVGAGVGCCKRWVDEAAAAAAAEAGCGRADGWTGVRQARGRLLSGYMGWLDACRPELR